MRTQAALLLLLACGSSLEVPVAVKTVQSGETVSEPVINASALEKDDQLMTFHQGTLCAQYFCVDWICNNTQSTQFQVHSGALCLIIPNVNTSNSGQYQVFLNGNKNVLNLILHVQEAPQRSFSTRVIAVPVVLLVGIFLVICSVY